MGTDVGVFQVADVLPYGYVLPSPIIWMVCGRVAECPSPPQIVETQQSKQLEIYFSSLLNS